MIYAVRRPLSLAFVCLVLGFLFWPLWVGFPIMLFDANARAKEYLQHIGVKFSPKVANRLKRSWCARGVAEYLWPEAKGYYYSIGYRWYHILPDGFPWCFINIDFWKKVVGVR